MAGPQDYKLQIPPEVVKFIDKSAPREAKLLAAKGLVPMQPNVLVTALYMLTLDSDEEVSNNASKSLLGQPPTILMSLFGQPLHPKILDFYARHSLDKGDFLEQILINKMTPDETFIFLAPQVNERLLTIISENQERLLRTPKIAEEFRKNPHLSQSTIDRVASFLRLNGIVLEGMSAELTPAEIKQLMQEDDKNILQAIFDDSEDKSLEDLSVALFEDKDDDAKEVKPEDDRRILRRLSTLSVSQKIKLALKGNKEVRNALIKDPNKLVATSVVKSPKIQESEVVSISTMRSVNDEVLRIISADPEWTKNYTIKYNLVGNPKTPLVYSMMFLKQLRPNEVVQVSKNKNVSQQLQKAAKQLAQTKRR